MDDSAASSLEDTAKTRMEDLNVALEDRVDERAVQLTAQALLLAKSSDALRVESRTLQAVLDNMEEGLTAATTNGEFTLWNRAAERMLGTAAKNQLRIEEWSEGYGVFLPDSETPCPTEQIPLVRAMSGESCNAELYIRNSGRPEGVWIEVSARPLKDEAGVILGGLATFRDISGRRRDANQIRVLNDELEQKVQRRTEQLEAANAELEAFTYSVSHDLRAPLRHISGFSRLLVEDFGEQLEPEAKRYLDRITEGSRKMGVLVDELLNLARVGRHSLNVTFSELNPVVLEIIGILAPDAEKRIVEWKIEDLGSVNCDTILIGQIFQNLISNSLKFTRPRATAIIEIGRLKNSEEPTFFVRDNGVGFDMKYSDKLFGVFQRLHRVEDFEGTGIGLATVRRIVQKHGGKTWADAEVGKGATFYFSLALPGEAQVIPAHSELAVGVQS